MITVCVHLAITLPHPNVAEFAGRFNDRPLDTLDQMAAIARGLVGGRLLYRDLIG